MSRIVLGDAIEKLRDLPDWTVRCCVTSPPFWGLRDYGVEGQIGLERTPEEYVAKLVAVFREVRRVLADDGTLWLNLGDSYTSGGCKERDPGQSKIHPAFEGESFADGLRPDTPPGLKPKDLVGIPWRVAFALQADGWWLRSDIIWSKRAPMPESVLDRPTRSHEYVFLLTRSERYYYNAAAIAEPVEKGDHPRDDTPPPSLVPGASNHNGLRSWWKKSGNKERRVADGGEGERPADRRGSSIPWQGITRNKRSVWTLGPEPFPEAHFATFPPALVEPCILAGSAIGDTVLDPFCGAGTTGLVASRWNRNFVGIELNPKYAEMAQRRIEQDAPLLNEVFTSK